MDYVIVINNLLSSLIVANSVHTTIHCYYVDIQLHYTHFVIDVSDIKDEIPRINQLHFHLTH
jgi:hypothetical protein